MHKKGFTLIELMVVIAIIAILAAIALTSYRAYMRKAKAKELLNIARACVQEAVAQCQVEPNVTISDLDACKSDSYNDTQYLTGIEITTTGSCDGDISATAKATIKDTNISYEATCTYNATSKDMTCTSPRRSGSTE